MTFNNKNCTHILIMTFHNKNCTHLFVMTFHNELEKSPYQHHQPTTVAHPGQEHLLNEEILTLLSKGAIAKVPLTQAGGGFFLTMFLVPKEGNYRPVINLRSLNRFLRVSHFKMEGMHIVRDLEDWMTWLDLKDAYLAIPIHSHHQKYLRFKWRGVSYQFKVRPFGLATAPRVFTKILRPVITLLRGMGIRCVIYLDDILLMSQCREEAQQHTWTTVDLLESLGFIVNFKKSVLEPTQELTFLGFILNSRKRELKLPQEKVTLIKKEARSLLAWREVSPRDLARFIGKLSAAILALYPAPLHYRSLQQLKHRALRALNYDQLIEISTPARTDLQWWVDHIDQWNGRPTLQLSPSLVIETDASKLGWGAFCEGQITGGCWSREESALHINALELIVGTFGVQSFCKNTQVVSVLVKSDNTTVVSHINRMGGMKSPLLVHLVKELWQWCLQRGIQLRAEHLPGKKNLMADFLSRHLRDRSDWILNREMFSMINQRLGPLDLDLFATRFST